MGASGVGAGKAPNRGTRAAKKARRRDLVGQWRALYRANPPAGLPSCWLEMAVAYRLQERSYGALSPSLRRQLLESGDSSRSQSGRANQKLAAGTVLVREWQGARHTVTILDKGVSHNGKLYRSLTAVADAITGAHWSGPEFFGLNAKRGVERP